MHKTKPLNDYLINGGALPRNVEDEIRLSLAFCGEHPERVSDQQLLACKDFPKGHGSFLANQSRFIDKQMICNYEAMDTAITYLSNQLEMHNMKGAKDRHLRFLVQELVRQHQLCTGTCLRVGMSNNDWAKSDPHNPGEYTSQISKLVHRMRDSGYIHYTKGIHDSELGKRVSRIRVSAKFVEEVLPMIDLAAIRYKLHPRSVLIWQGYGNGNKVPLRNPSNQRLKNAERLLSRYNAMMSCTEIQFPSRCDWREADPSKKFLHRVYYRGSISLGGRFFGAAYQGLSSEIRSKILINGEETIELDFSAMSINLLYAKKRLNAPEGDLYHLKDVSRDTVKAAAMMLFNSQDREQGYGAFSNKLKLPFNGGQTRQLYNTIEALFKEKHPCLTEFLYQDMAGWLHLKDSSIAEEIIRRHVRAKIPILAIHDSFIVPAQHEHFLRAAMHQSYIKVMGEYSVPDIHD